MQANGRSLNWQFPLPRPHTGTLLGNATQGVMIWGERSLNLTVGRAGFWDHRGGNAFASKTTYQQLRTLLEANDQQAVLDIFASTKRSGEHQLRPHQLGCGRLELTFPDGLTPTAATLDMATATVHVTLTNATGRSETVCLRQAMDQELTWIELPPALRGKVQIAPIPTWQHIGEEIAPQGVQPPTVHPYGWTQSLPEDPALAFAFCDRGDAITLATALGDTVADDPTPRAVSLARSADLALAAQRAGEWWRAYWADIPTLNLPDPVLQRAYDYGVYKQAGLTSGEGGGRNSANTPGIPASLQGPWMEEYQVPPWSNDYHFNINIQMIYWPALATNRLTHLRPLWDMVFSWLPRLRQNAEGFFHTSEALMLPHAVDDCCMAVGQFWTGTIDHACTAWMAQMAWLQYRYSMDTAVLRDIAWPLLVGAFNGYWAMLEERTVDGQQRLSLPVSVSPEYNGSNFTAWGRDASFQLAALHFVADALPKAAAILGHPVDPRWARVATELPPYTLVPAVPAHNVVALTTMDGTRPTAEPTTTNRTMAGWGEESRPGPRIGLWQGKDFDVSHRHPSHLGAIYPFCTVDPAAPEHAPIVANSIRHWVKMGIGAWSGWAIIFAALIHSRVNHADAVVQLLHIWDETFTNEGHGTLHDAMFPGISVISGSGRAEDGEIMQMDAGMGVITVITDLLVQQRGDDLVILPQLPRRWRKLSFENIRTEGAFLISATVDGSKVQEVWVRSLAGAALSLVHNLGNAWTLDGEARSGPRLEMATEKGRLYLLRRA